jgi:hypothetical protein
MQGHATITGLSLRRNASMQIGWGFGGREGARTPDLLVANVKFVVQGVRNVQCVQQIALGGHKSLRQFSLVDWTLGWTAKRDFADRKMWLRDRGRQQ